MLLHSQNVYTSVAHRYWVPQWSPQQNAEVYGTQGSPEGVGSNLRLELQAPTDPGPRLQHLKKLIDHQNLFLNFAEFKARPSTLENITLFLIMHLNGDWQRLSVWENDNFACQFERGQGFVTMLEKVLNLHFVVRRAVDPMSGLALARGELMRVVRQVAPTYSEDAAESEAQWGRRLFSSFAEEVKGLHELRVDLGSQRALRLIADKA